MKKSTYTDEMVDFLCANVNNYGWAELAQRFNEKFNCNRSGAAIRCFCSKRNNQLINLTRKSQPPYTEEMASFLSSCLSEEKYNWAELTELFNRTFKCTKSVDTLMKFCRANEKCSTFRVKSKQLYTKEMTEFLYENFSGISYSELTKLFNNKFKTNKKTASIKMHCLQKGLEKNTHVTDKIAEFLHANYRDLSHEELTRRFNAVFNQNKTVYNIKSYCVKYGLKKYEQHTFPVGSESLRGTSGRIFIKVNDKEWKAKHRLLWEEKNGPIPEGYRVIFADGNTKNFDSENLVLASNSEVTFMKNSGLLLNNEELTKIGLKIAKIKLKINDYNNSK